MDIIQLGAGTIAQQKMEIAGAIRYQSRCSGMQLTVDDGYH